MSQAEPDFPMTLVISKGGELRWLGHLDFARAVARALRRAGLKMRHSEGFHPRPKLRLPEPLPVGVGSDGELFVVSLSEPGDSADVALRLARHLPKGLVLVSATAGAWPEPRDAPVELRLGSERPEVLRELLVRLAAAGDALAATFEVVAGGGTVRVRLRAPAGERPSIVRFLTAMKPLAGAIGAPLDEVDRTAPSLAAGAALQSPAPFAPT